MKYTDLKDYVVNTLKNNAATLGYNVVVGEGGEIPPMVKVVYFNNGIKKGESGFPVAFVLSFDIYITIDGSEDSETAIDNLTELSLEILDLFDCNIVKLEDSKTLGNVFFSDKVTHIINFYGYYNEY